MVEEIQKIQPDLRMVEKLMQMTFALRRQEIVQDNPLVKDFLQKWPALKIGSQVKHIPFLFSATLLKVYFQAKF